MSSLFIAFEVIVSVTALLGQGRMKPVSLERRFQ